MNEKQAPKYAFRRLLVLGTLGLAVALLAWRMVDLHVLRKDFLQDQGDARALRVVELAAHRGMITDRYGEPLAVSTPVDSVWVNPQEFALARESWGRLARLLGLEVERVEQLLAKRREREFTYLKRHVHPQLAQRVMALEIPGVSLQREYRRYYPTGEVSAHVIGFTNIDDAGQESLELAYDQWLRGTAGSKRVIKDRLGRTIENVESIRAPQPGKDLSVSLDRRIQYFAYRELKAAVKKHRARSGSAVVLDVRTGEVLAMVNQPAFNPNNRSSLSGERYRNRAVTDVFEPGSAIKPFTIAAALITGSYRPDTVVHTAPGYFRVGHDTVRDIRNYGDIDVATVLKKSSNVGASKIALSIPAGRLWETLSRAGFGRITESGFPGESGGLLTNYRRWREIERATMAFGYGLSVTLLQLAQAYAAIAADGTLHPATFQRVDEIAQVAERSRRILPAKVARQVRAMLEAVVDEGGTGKRARIQGYRVAGKTGTVRKSTEGGYAEDRYIAVFAGMAPASAPRLVMAVVINEPSAGQYYGGRVAAPVFAKVMGEALRLMNVAPDDMGSLRARMARYREARESKSSPATEDSL